MRYDIIHESSTVKERAQKALVQKVEEMGASGWGPKGGVEFLIENTADGEITYHYVQAMVRQ